MQNFSSSDSVNLKDFYDFHFATTRVNHQDKMNSSRNKHSSRNVPSGLVGSDLKSSRAKLFWSLTWSASPFKRFSTLTKASCFSNVMLKHNMYGRNGGPIKRVIPKCFGPLHLLMPAGYWPLASVREPLIRFVLRSWLWTTPHSSGHGLSIEEPLWLMTVTFPLQSNLESLHRLPVGL